MIPLRYALRNSYIWWLFITFVKRQICSGGVEGALSCRPRASKQTSDLVAVQRKLWFRVGCACDVISFTAYTVPSGGSYWAGTGRSANVSGSAHPHPSQTSRFVVAWKPVWIFYCTVSSSCALIFLISAACDSVLNLHVFLYWYWYRIRSVYPSVKLWHCVETVAYTIQLFHHPVGTSHALVFIVKTALQIFDGNALNARTLI